MPSPYIFTHISDMKIPKNMNSAKSGSTSRGGGRDEGSRQGKDREKEKKKEVEKGKREKADRRFTEGRKSGKESQPNTSDTRALHFLTVYTLTEEVREGLGLVVVYHGHAQGVEAHQTQHGPVEGLGLHDVADEEAQTTLPLVEVGAFQLGALQAGPGKG